MITVGVDELFVSWLDSLLPGVAVSSERLPKLEDSLPAVQVRRGVSGGQRGLDLPRIDCDFYAASRTAAGDLGRAVQRLFEESTPVGWRGAQFAWLRCNQAVMIVPDANARVHHAVSINSFSLQ